jgi:hypothetical protein
MGERVGPFDLGQPQPHWGSGWFCARAVDAEADDLPPMALVRASLAGENTAIALEGAHRMRLRSPHVPRFVRGGFDENGRAWLCFAAAVAVPLEQLLEVNGAGEALPVPVALAIANDLIGALAALDAARVTRNNDEHAMPALPSFDEMLVDDRGNLVVTTPPPGTRMTRPGLLKIARRDRFLMAPGYDRLDRTAVFAVGSVLHQLVTAGEPLDEHGNFVAPRDLVDDVPGRVDDVVRRAMAADPGARFESMDELREAIARAAEDFPPLDDAERASCFMQRGREKFAQAERWMT